MTSSERPLLNQFPCHSMDKLRYGDTDRQGHINNAVFSSWLETGRVEMLYGALMNAVSPGCAFVIARLQLDFWREVTWPGQVDIGTRVLRVGRSSFVLTQAVYQHGHCVATAETVMVQMNEGTRQSQALSEDMVKGLQAFTDPPPA